MKARRFSIRLAALLLALVIVFALPAAVNAAPPIPPDGRGYYDGGTAATVTARLGLNMRSGPGLGYRVVLVLRRGEGVRVCGGATWREGIPWVFVRVYRSGYVYEGYCAETYLSTYGGHVEPPPPSGGRLKVIAGAGLRLRAGPGLGYAILRIVPYGTLLRPTGESRWANGYEWKRVEVGGRCFWAAAAYLQWT
jgi:uncharacterized protein YraI